MLGTLCTTLLLALPLPLEVEAAEWLERLESPAATERSAAERWLAAHLEVQDLDALHAAVVASGAEGRGRLIGVLASSERHFELAALLGVDESAEVARVGRESLLELASSWSESAEKPGARRLDVLQELGVRAHDQFTLDPRAFELADALELLTIAGDSGVMLVLDPDLELARIAPEVDRRTAEELSGNQAELLAALARSYSLGFDGFGLDESGDMGWVRVCRRLRASKQSARELLVDWSLRVARDKNSPDAYACARALAASGWPAAIAWLEKRWLNRGDEAALAGLRLLAGRGLVSPSLRSNAVQAAWLTAERVHAAPEESARALAALGRYGAQGEALETQLLADWESLGAIERWVRLVALERRGSTSSESRTRVHAEARKVPENSSYDYQVLLTAAALDLHLENAFSPSRLLGLFEQGVRIDGGRELVQLLLMLSVEPLPNLDTASWSSEQRLALCEWYFLSERADLGARAGQLLAAIATATAMNESPANSKLIARLREWQRIGRGHELTEWLKTIEAYSPEFSTIRIHLGLFAPGETNALATKLLASAAKGEDSPVDLQTLAALVATRASPEILDLLAKRARNARISSLEIALDEAVRVLRENRLDSRLEAFAQEIHRTGWSESWPPPPKRRALPLRVFDRRFEP